MAKSDRLLTHPELARNHQQTSVATSEDIISFEACDQATPRNRSDYQNDEPPESPKRVQNRPSWQSGTGLTTELTHRFR